MSYGLDSFHDPSFDDDHNPYRVPDVSERSRQRVTGSPGRTLLPFRIACVLQVATVLIGTIVAWFEIESIIVTGPLLTVLGITVLTMAIRIQSMLGALVGGSGPTISLLVFLVILVFDLGPREAQIPVSVIASLYAMTCVPLIIIACILVSTGDPVRSVVHDGSPVQ
ncbi:MAG: hypothetical protein KDA85_07575 [Planctomycetaceae bacterium]|nr:hypothetical protein [Planctomycetaceae bacterium]